MAKLTARDIRNSHRLSEDDLPDEVDGIPVVVGQGARKGLYQMISLEDAGMEMRWLGSDSIFPPPPEPLPNPLPYSPFAAEL